VNSLEMLKRITSKQLLMLNLSLKINKMKEKEKEKKHSNIKWKAMARLSFYYSSPKIFTTTICLDEPTKCGFLLTT